jgi:hypothetical protein
LRITTLELVCTSAYCPRCALAATASGASLRRAEPPPDAGHETLNRFDEPAVVLPG